MSASFDRYNYRVLANYWVGTLLPAMLLPNDLSRNLCLVLGMSSQTWQSLRGAIEYNVLLYKDGLLQILAAIEEDRKIAA